MTKKCDLVFQSKLFELKLNGYRSAEQKGAMIITKSFGGLIVAAEVKRLTLLRTAALKKDLASFKQIGLSLSLLMLKGNLNYSKPMSTALTIRR